MPRSSLLKPSQGLLNRIIGALATRFAKRPPAIRPHLPQEYVQWAKLRILSGGDTVHAASMTKFKNDTRDQTFVRVSNIRLIMLGLPLTPRGDSTKLT